ncbi:MAG: hypothetical protein RLP15_08030 [Cryomorphaceae bacterium]
MKSLVSIFLLVIVCQFGLAQEYVDLLSVQHLHQLDGADGPLPGQTRYSESALDLLVPIVLSDAAALLTGVIAEQTTLHRTEYLFSTVYGITLKIGANIKHTDQFHATYLLLPKLSSDLTEVNTDHLQIGGVFLGKYIVSPNFNVRFGVYANREFFGPFLVPFAGVYLKKGNWELKGAVPINAEASHAFMEEVIRVGAVFNGINRSYFIGGVTNSYIEKSNNEVGAFGHYALGNAILRAEFGHSVGRKLMKFDAGDGVDLAFPLKKINNNRVESGAVTPNGIYTRVSFIYRLPT